MSEILIPVTQSSTFLAKGAAGGNSRYVNIPCNPSLGNSNTTTDILIEFDRSHFQTEELEGGRIGTRIKIPEGITVTVTVDDYGFQLTKRDRTKPISVASSGSGLKKSLTPDGYVVIEVNPLSRVPGAGQMNLALNVKDILAAFTYLQGKPHEQDSGVGTVTERTDQLTRELHSA